MVTKEQVQKTLAELNKVEQEWRELRFKDVLNKTERTEFNALTEKRAQLSEQYRYELAGAEYVKHAVVKEPDVTDNRRGPRLGQGKASVEAASDFEYAKSFVETTGTLTHFCYSVKCLTEREVEPVLRGNSVRYKCLSCGNIILPTVRELQRAS